MASSLTSLVLLLTCALLFSTFVPSTADFLADEFKKWMKDFGVRYKTKAEAQKRFAIFKANYNFINATNHNPEIKFKVGLNSFADMTKDEFLAQLTGSIPPSSSQTSTSFRYANTRAPSWIDWRYRGAVTAVKNQGRCGK